MGKNKEQYQQYSASSAMKDFGINVGSQMIGSAASTVGAFIAESVCEKIRDNRKKKKLKKKKSTLEKNTKKYDICFVTSQEVREHLEIVEERNAYLEKIINGDLDEYDINDEDDEYDDLSDYQKSILERAVR